MRPGIDWTLGAEIGESPLQRFWTSSKLEPRALVLGFIGVSIPIFVLFRGLCVGIDLRVERSIIVALLAMYAFLRFPSGKQKWNEPPGNLFSIDLILVLLVIATEAYTLYGVVIQDTASITCQLFGYTVNTDIIVGTVLLGLVFEAVRRSFGWVTLAVALFFMIHSLFAMSFPQPLYGASISWSYLINIQYVLEEGIYGAGADILLTMMLPFLIFGYLIAYTKCSAFFIALANAMVGRYVGGPAKVAVISSAFIGGITGSGAANVVTTGCVTIPMMKSIGYKPAFAGAVETTASSASYFVPPVLGAAGFLIAIFTNTSYLTVCLACVVPSFLYFLGVFLQVHLRAKKQGLAGMPEDTVPSIKIVLRQGGHLFIPIIVVVGGMALGYSVTLVAIAAVLCVIIVSFLKKETRLDTRNMLIAFDKLTDQTAGISLTVISVGMIQGAIMASGLGMRISLIVEALAGGNILIALILAAVVCLILGMGVNPTLVYYIAYIFVIPALIKIGVPVLSAHIFVLIYGGLANITPPVAVAAYIAANIAKASPMRTAFEACKLGFAGFFVPFLLVFYPSILLVGATDPVTTIYNVLVAGAGIAFISFSFEGWVLKRASVFQRILLFMGGICLVLNFLPLAIAGFCLGIVVFLWQKFR